MDSKIKVQFYSACQRCYTYKQNGAMCSLHGHINAVDCEECRDFKLEDYWAFKDYTFLKASEVQNVFHRHES